MRARNALLLRSRGGGPPGKILWLDNLSHAYVNPARPQYLLLEYLWRIEIIVAAFRPGSSPLTVLHIGGGGFAYPGYLAAARPGTDRRCSSSIPRWSRSRARSSG